MWVLERVYSVGVRERESVVWVLERECSVGVRERVVWVIERKKKRVCAIVEIETTIITELTLCGLLNVPVHSDLGWIRDQ